MAIYSASPVLPTNEARVALPKALARFRERGALAEPVVFGAQRRPEGVMIPFELYEELLPVIEDVEIAHLVRERTAAGNAVPLADVAAAIGLNADDYR
jgi:antitoxin StbD